jgi:GT2 family glycosyltransferase
LSDYLGEVEILVVDNGTTEPIATALLTSLADAESIKLVRYPGPFSWSAFNNRAVSETTGEVLVFLNNDIVAIRPGWLRELVSQALRPDVGAVGARLIYGDRTIQHAGAVVGVTGGAWHESVGKATSDGGYLGRTKLQHRSSVVTGACLATRREVFERLDGFDEGAFRMSFNDLDFCMRAREEGFAVVYSPVATLFHFESMSRGVASPSAVAGEEQDEFVAFRARWGHAMRVDPYYNPHFDRVAEPFAYLSAPRRSH